MGSALLLWAGFQESGQDDPTGNFHFCAFNDRVSVWAELKKFILEAKSKRPWLFVNHRCVCLLPCSQTFPGFQGFTGQAARGESCQELGGEELPWGWGGWQRTCPCGTPGTPRSRLAVAGESFGFHTAGDSRCWEERCGVGRCPAPANCVAEVSEKRMDLMGQGVLGNACRRWLVPVNTRAFKYRGKHEHLVAPNLRLKSGFSCPVLGLVLLRTYWLTSVFMLADSQLLNNQYIVGLVIDSSLPLPTPRRSKQ